MISEIARELVDVAYTIKPNQDKNLAKDQNFFEDTQHDSLRKTFSPTVIQSQTVIIPESQETPVLF